MVYFNMNEKSKKIAMANVYYGQSGTNEVWIDVKPKDRHKEEGAGHFHIRTSVGNAMAKAKGHPEKKPYAVCDVFEDRSIEIEDKDCILDKCFNEYNFSSAVQEDVVFNAILAFQISENKDELANVLRGYNFVL